MLGAPLARKPRAPEVSARRSRCGRPDHTGTLRELPAQHGDDANAVDHRHLQVDDHNVGRVGQGTIEGLAAVCRGRDHLDVGLALEQRDQRLADQFLVIGDQHPD